VPGPGRKALPITLIVVSVSSMLRTYASKSEESEEGIMMGGIAQDGYSHVKLDSQIQSPS
jgi:hypothetical protein